MRRMGRSLPRAVVVPAGAGLAVAAGLLLAGLVTDDGGAGAPDGRAGVARAAEAKVLDPGARRNAPALAGDDLDGEPVGLAAFRGHVVVLNVWGSWCGPCRAEAEDLARLSRETPVEEVRFLGINTRDPDRTAARSFVREHGLDFPSLHDPSGALLLRFPPELLNPQAVPSTLVIDRRGRIAVAIGGAVTGEQLRPLLARVVEEES
ncbi:TlpA disulfide reductase family protein [Streptomyces sp. MB09-01]|uniref:TlpA family protein disulfide reductase n=1 Tax=Streptomyces sp. MB09-01 TaxID=3028666 RepID=UPI0029AB4C1A|nr:TlpA disulfide reductase family protein [Streptomyces sp. MB09-01]MDX3533818.1 TlpA disulfide reductase family protein [Streptomyces sp. MB09-01]